VSAREPAARFAAALAAPLGHDREIVRAWLDARSDGKRVLTVELEARPPDLEAASRRAQKLAIQLQALLGRDAQGIEIGVGAGEDVGEPGPTATIVYARAERR
jgi:hypothetical protein